MTDQLPQTSVPQQPGQSNQQPVQPAQPVPTQATQPPVLTPQQPVQQQPQAQYSQQPQPQQFAVQSSTPQYKLHHSYIWMSALRAFPYIFLAILISGVSAGMSEYTQFLGGGVLLLAIGDLLLSVLLSALLVGINAISYRYKWYQFDASEFSYFEGVFNKKRTHIPYQKVQSVNQKASLMQRLIGVCTVSIETAGGADNQATSVQYVKKDEAERIRQQIFLRKQFMDAGYTPEQAQAQVEAYNQQFAYQQNLVSMPPAGVGAAQQGAAVPVPVQPGVPMPPAQPGAQMPPAQPGMPVQPAQPGAPVQPSASTAPLQPGVSFGTNVLDVPAQAANDMRGIFGGNEINTGSVTYEHGLTNKELVFSALTGHTSLALIVVAIVSAVVSAISFAVDARLFSEGQVEGTFNAVVSGVSVMPLHVLVFLLLGLLALLAIIWALSILGTCITYGGFKACRRGDRIEVEHGILSHTFSGMDINRIQTINIKQTFFQRLLGYCSLSYGRVGTVRDASEGDNSNTVTIDSHLIVHPFLKLSRVPDVIQCLTPEHADVPQCNRRVSPKALRRGLIRQVIWQGEGFWLAVVIGICWLATCGIANLLTGQDAQEFALVANVLFTIYPFLMAFAGVLAVLDVVGTVLWYRQSGFGFSPRYLALCNAGFSVETVIVPRQKIQYAYLQTNPLQRFSKVSTIVAVTAAGVGQKKEKLIDVTESDAQTWLRWAKPGGSNVCIGE